MDSTSRTGFIHSTPVPRIYKLAAKIAENVKEGRDSLKNLIYAEKHANLKRLYALVVEALKRDEIMDGLIQKSQLLVKEPRFNVWLAKILISELLWGKNKMVKGSKPVDTILSYEKVFRKLLEDCDDTVKSILKYNIAKPRYVRVNTLKISTKEAVNNFRDEGWSLVPFFNKTDYNGFLERLSSLQSDEFMTDIHIPDLLIFPPKTEFYGHEAYKSGSIILQDKASCLPVHLLAPPPGSIVLDTCAAPGMKSTQLAALLQNKGTVYAVELNPKRAAILNELVESVSATCIKTIIKDVMQVTADDCPDVEYILVDPSCTGSGITDRIEIEKLDLPTKMQRLKKLCNFQAKLLRHTMNAFPKAKRIVYSTCSINSEENEDVVRQTLETARNFKLVDARKSLQSWNTKTSDLYPELGDMCIFASPEEDKTNGFFVAVFERLQEGEKNQYLNFELCKFFDREARKNNNYNNDQETNSFHSKKDKNNRKNHSQMNGKSKDYETNQNNYKNEDKFERKNKRKKEVEESLEESNNGTLEVSVGNSNEEQITNEYSSPKKKRKNKQSQEEKRSTVSENTKASDREKKKKKDTIQEENDDRIVIDNSTVKKDKKHKKSHKEGKVSEPSTEYSLKEETSKSELVVEDSNGNDSISCKEKKKKHKKDKSTESLTPLSTDENIDQISDKKKKTKNSSEEGTLNISFSKGPIQNKEKKEKKNGSCSKEDTSFDETSTKEKKKKKKNLNEECENVEACTGNSTLSEDKSNEKKKKKKNSNKNENSALIDESETKELTTNEEMKTKKSHKKNKDFELSMENLDQHKISVDKESEDSNKKNKKRKRSSIVKNENSEPTEISEQFTEKEKKRDEENSAIEGSLKSPKIKKKKRIESEIDEELGQNEVTKIKKKRKTSIVENDLEEPKAKKIKKE